MRIGYRRGLALAAAMAAALMAVSQAPPVASVLAAAPRPTILGARADLALGTLTISGRGFGGVSDVALGGAPLAMSSVTDDTIVADLPPGVPPGSLLLTVGAGNRADSFAATIPATDIVTASGITIRSTASDVQIAAGTSLITVDPAGGITITSPGRISLDAHGELALRGNSVRIDSASTLRLAGASSIDVISSGNANVNAAGAMTIRGSLINLN